MSQKGFSHIVAFVISLTLLAVGFAGWYVWNKSKQDKASQSSSQTGVPKQGEQQKPESTKQSDPYDGWQTYVNPTYGITFRYPADWKVEETLMDDPSSSATRQEYAINVKRKENVKYSNTISLEILYDSLSRISSWYESEKGESSTHTKTKNDLKGKPSVQFLSPDDLNSKIYLFGVEERTYSFSSINEGINIEADSAYWAKFTKVFDSLQITK